MFWIYVLVGTGGLVALVPAVLQIMDGLPSSLVGGAIGAGCTLFAATGLLLQQFSIGGRQAAIAALALGLAAGAIYPEAIAKTDMTES